MKIVYPLSLQSDIVSNYISNYGRLYGWFLANCFGLPTQKSCYLLSNENDLSAVNEKSMLYVRADMPWGRGNGLIRSRDIYMNELRDFFLQAKQYSDKAIVISFLHPSVWITGKYLPRYKTSGASQILFRSDKTIIVEMVGAGFDCGDISRGKAVHQRIVLLADNIGLSYDEIINCQSNIQQHSLVNQRMYNSLRESRIHELIAFYGNAYSEEIKDSIPLTVTNLRSQFEAIKKECIISLLANNDIWNDYVIMINHYMNRPYVYEVWQPKRSSIEK